MTTFLVWIALLALLVGSRYLVRYVRRDGFGTPPPHRLNTGLYRR